MTGSLSATIQPDPMSLLFTLVRLIDEALDLTTLKLDYNCLSSCIFPNYLAMNTTVMVLINVNITIL